MYLCPKCDKGLSKEELNEGQCNNCRLEFTVKNKTDLSLLNDNVLIEKFSEEVRRDKRRKISTNFYETAINILKAYLTNVICIRRKDYCSFFLTRNVEMVCFLFKVHRVRSYVCVYFDLNLTKYKKISKCPDYKTRTGRFGPMKSVLRTKDLEYMMSVCLSVYDRKTRQYNEVLKGGTQNVKTYRVEGYMGK